VQISAFCLVVTYWRKILDEFACHDHRSSSRSFLEGLRSVGMVMNCSVAGIEIASHFLTFIFVFHSNARLLQYRVPVYRVNFGLSEFRAGCTNAT